MARNVLAARVVSIVKVAAYHEDATASLRLFFSDSNPQYDYRFITKDRGTVAAELIDRLDETDLRSSFAVLSQVEAAFRRDYAERCEKKKSDPLSKAFRALYRKRGTRVGLREHILATWREKYPDKRQTISELNGAFNLRHWVAHGAGWEVNLGRKYDYRYIYSLADSIFENFPLEGLDR